MPTNNAINLNAQGIAYYDGVGNFTAPAITDHGVVIGDTNNSITSTAAPSATSGVALVSQGAAADPVFGTVVVAGGGTGATSLTAHSLILGQGTSAMTALGAAVNGQIPIGSTGNDPILATLTAGSGISVSNGAGSITISATGSGLAWTEVTGTSQTMAIDNGYVASNAGLVTLTLPATAAQFSILRIVGKGVGGWTIAQNIGQSIILGSSATTAGITGSLSSTNANDCVELLATTGGSGTVWTVLSSIGNLTVV